MLTTITTKTDETSTCPTCREPPLVNGGKTWGTYGPCKDGKFHYDTCPVARREMAAATWPCGQRKYPDVVAPSHCGRFVRGCGVHPTCVCTCEKCVKQD